MSNNLSIFSITAYSYYFAIYVNDVLVLSRFYGHFLLDEVIEHFAAVTVSGSSDSVFYSSFALDISGTAPGSDVYYSYSRLLYIYAKAAIPSDLWVTVTAEVLTELKSQYGGEIYLKYLKMF